MARIFGVLFTTIIVASIFAGCVVREEDRRCPNGWEPEHRDREGRLVGGHCR